MRDVLQVLLVEDSADDAELVLRAIRKDGRKAEAVRVQSATEMENALSTRDWDLVVSDFNLPGFSGTEAMKLLKASRHEIPFILVSGTMSEETAVEALTMGATDCVLKGNLGRLPSAIDRALREFDSRAENRNLTEQLIHSQKMEAIGRLTSGVAHDVNNVLGAITLLSETALDDLERGNLAEAKTGITEILKAQGSAARIVRQLLLFSCKQSQPAVIVDFATAIRSIRSLVEHIATEGVRVEYHLPKDPLPVVADPTNLEQIVMNLVVNAKDAMPEGGTLTISVERARLEAKPAGARIPVIAGDYVCLSVRDTGTGIPPEILNRICEPFFTTKEVGKGTGLGLSVIYGIIQQAGGSLAVLSTVGQGSTFQVYWPLAQDLAASDTASASKSAAKDAATDSNHILLVDDEETMRKPVAAMLRKRGCTVHEASDGERAMGVVRDPQVRIDLLITDMIMPIMGGTELIARAREIRPSLPALILSGSIGDARLDATGKTPTRFLAKPFSQRDLIEKIQQIFHPQTEEQTHGT